MMKPLVLSLIIVVTGGYCTTPKASRSVDALKPVAVTEPVVYDTDDPAIWIHPSEPENSLIIGTDKETGGGLYAFDLQGKIVRKVTGLQRPNNVDIAYGFRLNGATYDIAVVTERETNQVRIYSLPELEPLDGNGLPVFEGEQQRAPMGIACYTPPGNEGIYLIVSRKNGPAEGYLWQYKLEDNNGLPALKLVRKFGRFSGRKEIESIAVDNESGFVYYSDEQVGIRKYHADPAKGNEELALFGKGEFRRDNEGISIYKLDDTTGYILVSDQSRHSFNIYPREGVAGNPHQHVRIASVPVSAMESDGSEVTSISLPEFAGGMFVAMSTDKTFHIYRWADIAEKAGLKIRK